MLRSRYFLAVLALASGLGAAAAALQFGSLPVVAALAIVAFLLLVTLLWQAQIQGRFALAVGTALSGSILGLAGSHIDLRLATGLVENAMASNTAEPAAVASLRAIDGEDARLSPSTTALPSADLTVGNDAPQKMQADMSELLAVANQPDRSEEGLAAALSLAIMSARFWDEEGETGNKAILTQALGAVESRLSGASGETLRRLQFSQGVLLRRIGGVDGDEAGALTAAKLALTQALDASTEALPANAAMEIHNELGLVHRMLAGKDNASPYLQSALAHFQSARSFALEAGNAEAAHIIAYNAVVALTNADASIRKTVGRKAHLELIEDALVGTTRDSQGLLWARLTLQKADILVAEGLPTLQVDLLRQARTALEEGLKNAQTDGRTPFEWALAQNQLANVLQGLGQAGYSEPILREALKARRNAWVLYQYAGLDQYKFYFDDRIAAIEQLLGDVEAPAPQPALEELMEQVPATSQ